MATERPLVDDWRTVEDALNAASSGASEPLYSQVEAAKGALFRLGCAAVEGQGREAVSRAADSQPGSDA